MIGNEIIKAAVVSRCHRYRYRLTRYWGPGPMLPFVMLNPSTADASNDDPTIRRCMAFARREGAGGIVVANLFAFRATSPAKMLAAAEPFGPENEGHLIEIGVTSVVTNMPIVCAWGSHAAGKDQPVIDLFKRQGARLTCLGKTAGGQPRHPLYVLGTQPLVPLLEVGDGVSRSGYSDDYDDENGSLAMYRGMVASATRGKRGQALFKDILIAMNGMPERRLIAHDLEAKGSVCAIGAAGRLRGVDMSGLDPDDAETIAGRFNVADCLAREVVYANDECGYTSEFEWRDGRLRWREETPEERYERMRKWVRSQIKDPLFDVVWC